MTPYETAMNIEDFASFIAVGFALAVIWCAIKEFFTPKDK